MQSYPGSVHNEIAGNENAASRDMELFAAARAGSHVAFEELRSRHSHRLHRRIQLITRNSEDAEDALADTFLHAYLALDSFEGRSQVASWLTRIAINSALLVLRKRRMRAEVPLERTSEANEGAVMIEIQDSALNPEQIFDLGERSDHIARAISSLNINLRRSMKTWIEKQCSMKELARTLDLSLGAAKARLHRARKQLKCSRAFKGRALNAGSPCQSKRHSEMLQFQNREISCQSCD